MKKFIILLFIIILINPIMATAIDIENGYYSELPEYIMVRAQVIDILHDGETEFGFSYQVFIAEIRSGSLRGNTVIVENAFMGDYAIDIVVNSGDSIILALEFINNEFITAHVFSHSREFHLYILAIIFVLLLLIIAHLKGLKAIVALVLTAFLIGIMLQGTLNGHDPLILAIIISIIITIITMLLICGFNTKAYASIIGTTGGVLVAALISIWVGYAANLTGIYNLDVRSLRFLVDENFNFRNLLISGIIIGALGAVMDVAVSIASAMEEIKKNNPSISKTELIKSGMNVGKDIAGTMANTLILAYAGVSIPLLLLFLGFQASYISIINMEFIAVEVIRALSGSIGLIFAIPITAITYIALTRKKQTSVKGV